MSKKIRIARTPEGDDIIARFSDQFLALTGFEYPPSHSQWLEILEGQADFSPTQARQWIGEKAHTRKADGTLDPEDFSTSDASGEFPTATQTLMRQLRKNFTEEDRPAGEWCVIFGRAHIPPKPLSHMTFSNRRRGKKGKRIRCIEPSSQRYSVHKDDLPSGTKTLPLRDDIIRDHNAKPSA